ncbi:MAG: acetyl-CoA carboxylase biotin carboxyl carrier protein [Clostridia bacterium]|nr:acetyl-CoA carboxylase biotin carboxyl carrier protein [Clostridia bacterium]
MDYEQIKQLMKEMESSKLESVNIELADGTKISMKKEQEVISSTPGVATLPLKQEEVKVEEIKQEECKTITSPMVGTFYSKASPSSSPFVKVGDKVKKGDVVCIVEAMKLMNEIESDIDGEVIEVCCKEEDIVEYGTVLFKIK